MRIAVCDDNRKDSATLTGMLREVWPEAELAVFEDGGSLLRARREGQKMDLLFLDIFMKDMTGVEVGKIIREEFPEQEIVLVSVSKEFGPEAYDLDCLFYLVKPLQKDRLLEVKRRYQKKYATDLVVYDVELRYEQKISFGKLVYIESYHNYLFLHLVANSEIKIRSSMKEFAAQLDQRFLQINRGIIVNMDRVERMNSDSCEIDGKVFMLSRRQRAECKKKYMDYIFQHLEGEKNDGK